MRLSVDKAFVAVCTLCFLEPIFGMEVLSLLGELVYVYSSIWITYLSHILEEIITAPARKIPIVIILFL
jgi:hypothetical protein